MAFYLVAKTWCAQGSFADGTIQVCIASAIEKVAAGDAFLACQLYFLQFKQAVGRVYKQAIAFYNKCSRLCICRYLVFCCTENFQHLGLVLALDTCFLYLGPRARVGA